MTDKDMLERAARAAGYSLKWGETYIVGDAEVDCTDMPYVVSGQPDEADWHWDPLNDDGDCARLESALGINVEWFQVGVAAKALYDDRRPDVIVRVPFADHGGDRNKARRYASVRAAADMAK